MPVINNPKDEELIWAYGLEGFCLWSLDFMGLGRSTGHRNFFNTLLTGSTGKQTGRGQGKDNLKEQCPVTYVLKLGPCS